MSRMAAVVLEVSLPLVGFMFRNLCHGGYRCLGAWQKDGCGVAERAEIWRRERSTGRERISVRFNDFLSRFRTDVGGHGGLQGLKVPKKKRNRIKVR